MVSLLAPAAAFGQGLPPGLKTEGQLDGKLQIEPVVTGRIDAGDLELRGGIVKEKLVSRASTIDLLPEAARSSPFEVT